LKVAVLEQYPQVSVVHSNLHEIEEMELFSWRDIWTQKTIFDNVYRNELLVLAQAFFSDFYFIKVRLIY
jgi:hypothetical protein